MSAVLLWTRTNLRSRWRSAALVVLIAGLCGAMCMAAIAGARRTTTSFSRFVRATKDLNIYIAAPDRPTADAALSVMENAVGPRFAGEAVFLAAQPQAIDKSEEFSLGVIGDFTAANTREASIPRIVKGKAPAGAREVAVNDLAAKRFGVGPGDHLAMVGYSDAAFEACSSQPSECVTDVDLGDVTVAGVLRFPGDISPEISDSLTIALSPALTNSWISRVAAQQWLAGAFVESPTVRDQLGAAITDAIGPERISGDSADVFLETNAQGDPERVDGALEVEKNGLLILALLAGLAGLVAIPQALARQRSAASADDSRLLALGWTAHNQRRANTMWCALLGCAAALVAVVGAISISPLFPIGLARLAEPSPGVHADWVVLSLGALLTLVVVVASGALVSTGRARAPAARQGRLATLFSASRPVPATAGRFLLEEGRLSAVARTTLAAAVFGVGMVACAATVIHSHDFLSSRPGLYGAPWDLQGPVVGDAPDANALNALDDDARVTASAVLLGGRIRVDGEEIGAVAIDQQKGSIEPTILTGRPTSGNGEIVLGPAVMKHHHLSIGDSVKVQSSTETGVLTVVGIGVPPSVGSYSSGSGAIVSPSDYQRYGTPSTIENEGGVELAVRLTPGTDITAVRGEMANITGGFERVIRDTFRPARIANIDRVRSVPQIIAAFAALLTLLVLVHSLATVTARRRRDLSVLRALGMKPSQARHVLWWHAAILGALTLAIGIPLGVVGGRVLWHAITNSVDSVYSPHAPWAILLSVAAGLMILSVASGAALSRRAVPHSIAPLLRSE